ncbi:dynein light intermediate chain [Lycorma delicatula]|uniref:dynein light intermediate chain n=1 Tax=Lycorma delicatula TaxID=130591 RepID=UPI003F50D714
MVRTLDGSGSPGFSMKKKEESEDKDNLWTSILSEVQTRGSTKLPSCKSVLVLGDNESGKTTLIAKLQGVEDPKKGSGLEYAYIDVRDEYREDHTRLSVYVLDGEPSHAHLLRFALTHSSFPHTLVMFVVAMTTPWSLLEQLENWATVLQDHIDRLKIPPEKLQEYRNKCTKRWQEYVEQGEDLDLDSPLRRTSRNLDGEDGDSDVFPLGEGVLTRNLGLDVVVVVTKTDYMSTLEKESDYRDEHFDFIQQWIRRFCLQYGAALFYTSAKEDKNCDLLYKYLTHRIYGFPFRTPALVVEKDAVLIPSGWDSMKKISILYENMQSMKPDDYYRDVIAPPVTRKTVARETEIQAEEEQAFLGKQLALLQGSPPLRQESPMRSPAGVQKTGDRRIQGSPSVQTQLGSPKKIDTTKPGAAGTGEGVLANFFNSLLYKKTGAAGSPSLKSPNDLSLSPQQHSPVDKAAMRSDAAAELDRLTRKKPSHAQITINSPSPTTDQNSSEC